MSFNKKRYKIIKGAVSKELAKIAYNYLLIKRNAAAFMFENKILPPFDVTHGTWYDGQVNGTYSVYGDPLMETLLLYLKPLTKKHTKLNLYETYAYARTYKPGDVLKRHVDRHSCEISTTLNLGGDAWPLYLIDKKKIVKIDLKPGDMLIYEGNKIEHWREPLKGEVCVQAFLHYTLNENLKNDGRPILGLNSSLINVKK
jgi:hypothetical protein